SRHSRCPARKTPWLDRRLIAVLRGIASDLGRNGDTVGLVVVDDDYIRDINREYRGVDRSTDVISFAYTGDGGAAVDSGDVMGEVYVSHETLLRDASDRGVSPANLFLRIGVHGLLHVLGYEHSTHSDARRMESEEKRLLLEHLSQTEVEELF
ncbi:MAG: rRNA maturation RNase YbeY, partial [Candidatus Latescibacterota bacterium]